MRQCGRVGRVLSWHKEEDAMSIPKTPLEPDDFPVSAEGKKIGYPDFRVELLFAFGFL
jgi:hypothetical protein